MHEFKLELPSVNDSTRRRKRSSGSSRSHSSPSIASNVNPSPFDSAGFRFGDFFLWTGRILALILIAFAPWPYGMVEWRAQVLLVPWILAIFVMALAADLLNSKSEGIRTSRLLRLPAAAVGLSILVAIASCQSCVLPDFMWRWLSGGSYHEQQISELADSWITSTFPASEIDSSQSNVEQIAKFPRTVSIHPAQTLASNTTFAAAVLFCLSATVLFEGTLATTILLITIAASMTTLSLVGIAQNLLPNNWTLLSMPGPRHFATFVSRNSGPSALALGIGACLGMLIATQRKVRFNERDSHYGDRYPAVNTVAKFSRWLQDFAAQLNPAMIAIVVTLAVLTTAVITSASRGGILAVLIAGISAPLISLAHSRQWIRTYGSFAFIALLTFFVVNSLDLDQNTAERFESFSEEAHQLSNDRFVLWEMIANRTEFALFGSGLGTFRFAIIPSYNNHPGWFWYTHAENIYLELLLELGVIALVVAVIVLLLVLRSVIQQLESRSKVAIAMAALFSLLAISIQSLVDFSLILPGIFIPLAAMVGTLFSPSDSRKKSGNSLTDLRRNMTRRDLEPNDTNQARTDSTSSSNRSKSRLPNFSSQTASISVACLLVLLLSTFTGYSSLCGFAKAEQLVAQNYGNDAARLRRQSVDQLLRSPSENMFNYFAMTNHPEVLLHEARIALRNIVTEFSQSELWPKEMPESLKSELITPERISSAVRGGAEGPLAALLPYISADIELLEKIEEMSPGFKVTANACPLDWRGSWGLFQSDFGQWTQSSRNANYARLAYTTSSFHRLQATIGTNAICAGETEQGLEIWRRLLASSPQEMKWIVPLVGTSITLDQLVAILPDYDLTLLRAAVNLNSKTDPARNELSQKLLEKVDIQLCLQKATTRIDWELIAWRSKENGNTATEIEALRRLCQFSPSNPNLRYELAKLLDANGDYPEAIQMMEQAVRKAVQSETYQKYLLELRAKRRSTSAN